MNQTTIRDTIVLVVAGSRSITDCETVELHLSDVISTFPQNSPVRLVSGGATGVDSCAEQFARDHRYPIEVFEADWDTHGNVAGPIRNQQMAEEGDVLCAIWDGESPGTKDMIEKALNEGLDLFVFQEESDGA